MYTISQGGQSFANYPIGSELSAILNRAFPDQYEMSMLAVTNDALNLISDTTIKHFFVHVETIRKLFADLIVTTPVVPEIIEDVEETAASQHLGISAPEIFAVKALLEVENALMVLNIPESCFKDIDPLRPEIIHSEEAQLSLLAAQSYIAGAHQIANQFSITKKNAAKGGREKNAAAQSMKCEFILEYNELKPKPPVIQAARKYINKKHREGDTTLNKQHGPETLQRAYGKYKKTGVLP